MRFALHDRIPRADRIYHGSLPTKDTSTTARRLAERDAASSRRPDPDIADLHFALAPTFCLLHRGMPSSHHLVLGHSMGLFFIMGQKVVELFSVFDDGAYVPEAVHTSWKAQAMRTGSRRGAAGTRTFETVRARLLDPKPVLEVVVNNVYADHCPFLDTEQH